MVAHQTVRGDYHGKCIYAAGRDEYQLTVCETKPLYRLREGDWFDLVVAPSDFVAKSKSYSNVSPASSYGAVALLYNHKFVGYIFFGGYRGYSSFVTRVAQLGYTIVLKAKKCKNAISQYDRTPDIRVYTNDERLKIWCEVRSSIDCDVPFDEDIDVLSDWLYVRSFTPFSIPYGKKILRFIILSEDWLDEKPPLNKLLVLDDVKISEMMRIDNQSCHYLISSVDTGVLFKVIAYDWARKCDVSLSDYIVKDVLFSRVQDGAGSGFRTFLIAIVEDKVFDLSNGLGFSAGRKTSSAICCVEMNQRFNSVKEAANFTGFTSQSISKAIKSGSACYGYHWCRVDGK